MCHGFEKPVLASSGRTSPVRVHAGAGCRIRVWAANVHVTRPRAADTRTRGGLRHPPLV